MRPDTARRVAADSQSAIRIDCPLQEKILNVFRYNIRQSQLYGGIVIETLTYMLYRVKI